MLVEIHNKNIENRFANASGIAIYGAGIVAQSIYPLIKNSFQNKFAGFLVTEYEPEDPKNRITRELYQQPIWGIKNAPIDRETLIINVVASKFRLEIEDNLKERGFHNYIYLTTEIKNYLYERFYFQYFQEHGISIQNPWIKLQSKKGWQLEIRNPFLESERNRTSCFAELGTILLPACFDDFILSSEPLYEFEHINLCAFQRGVVFDCGANQGYFSALAAIKGHTVYAFEPSANLMDTLNSYTKKYQNLQVVEAAVSDYDGTGSLMLDAFCDDANSLVLNTNVASTKEVKVLTLDHFAEENNIKHIDFIKADIEGAERNMLLGAKRILETQSPYLSICTYHLPDDPQVIEQIIMDINPNYKIIHKEKKLYAYVESKSV